MGFWDPRTFGKWSISKGKSARKCAKKPKVSRLRRANKKQQEKTQEKTKNEDCKRGGGLRRPPPPPARGFLAANLTASLLAQSSSSSLSCFAASRIFLSLSSVVFSCYVGQLQFVLILACLPLGVSLLFFALDGDEGPKLCV